MKSGFAGKLAQALMNSKLTPLLMIAILAIGTYASFLTPREEEPQIDVPIADILLMYPGASPKEIESRVVEPLEKYLSNVSGVEYVYSNIMPEQAMLVVRFYVGDNVELSFVKMYNELMRNMDKFPQGVSLPLIKLRTIDDVPMMSLTLWSDNYDDFMLRRMAGELGSEVKKIPEVSTLNIIGGRTRQLKVILDRESLAGYHVDPMMVMQAVQGANNEMSSGKFNKNDREFLVQTGNFIQSKEDLEKLVVGVNGSTPVYLGQVANIQDGPQVPANYVQYGHGGAKASSEYYGNHQAVTLSIAKRQGADAMKIADKIIEKVDRLSPELLPSDVHVEVTRNYGETASHKVSELLLHLIGSIIAVTIIVAFAMGWRGGLVVFLSVPVTFALTLLTYYLLGYTLNRITLFALVFVTGIVVDDSIIIAENMHRHFKMKKLPKWQAAIASINEVGNPTILATFTVIASVLPMVFVSGLMGPYMSPMPIGASFAMLFSLLVALMVTPYLAYRLIKFEDDQKENGFVLEDSMIYKFYYKVMNPMVESPAKRWGFIGFTTLLLLGSMSLFYFKMVTVKMLPFDNKNEFQVIIDMPEGTTLERTNAATNAITEYLQTEKMVADYQTYVGTAAPINFNGLVRHYDFRGGSNVADIQVNLIDKSLRSEQSHDVAKLMRPKIQEIGKKFGANVKVVEVPPGPPVVSTLVAEIYGPDEKEQINIAKQVKEILETTDGIVDVDWMVEDDQKKYKFVVDKQKAAEKGINTAQVVQTMNLALNGMNAGRIYEEQEKEGVNIFLQLKETDRSDVEDLGRLKLMSSQGQMVPVSDIAKIEEQIQHKSIYRKNQKRVVYVMADVAGAKESPVYAIMDIKSRIADIKLKDGYTLEEHFTGQPEYEDQFGLAWDGEWFITYEVFRDLGTAFAVVLVIIYMLIIGWFQDFKVPLVMMVAIPLSMVGILIGHWLMGAFFTATSMIGMIALAGIMVRNSVLLIDFINLRLEEGANLKQAVIEAGAVRTTPILLTAGTVVIGAFVILFDPIFQGLAISLMGGSIASTVLTLLIVPLVYYMTEKSKRK
ncbi:efflux RND transporter permease subunit [Aureibacter tunicatorum]|uniref:Multidrug efflux pump subunit AcrB n=1 Tax=Aureibacter tunicatorum TaxID=866807 RepID=A0AAE3XN57_9BACT|nr:efflux RND transporter permease subunit [Aureibacter tunicatorum]MDR6240996.1 multidrug efflux pump subunit AcrB [Aureibacter tunicatorum]BDD03775.1 multidrug transporter AcrB [Aureibacter tunicatorum]